MIFNNIMLLVKLLRLFGAKMVPRNHINKNKLHKKTILCRFAIENIKNTKKTLFLNRESGRTVGLGRVAIIIE